MPRTKQSPELTATSYAILGLLAVRPWTTYELAKQIERGMQSFWPRAQSTLYEEPKKLVAHGLAGARKERTGKRPRTVYAITAKGRRALTAWLAQPADDPRVESEAALKAFFAEHAPDREAVLAHLRRVVEWADDSHERGRQIARGYLDSSTVFPERMHVISIVFPFIWDYTAAMRRWALWAIERVEAWEDPPLSGLADWDMLRRAAWSEPGDGSFLGSESQPGSKARR
jgi:DNA-binding PadR family transcriptional regulator